MTQDNSKTFDIPYVIGIINTLIKNCHLVLNEDVKRDGGFFTVINVKSKLLETPIILKFEIGQIPEEKYLRYLGLSYEKANRLCDNLAEGHYSSFQSRNPELDQWGGAILAGDYILSFSGMSSELIDESIMLLLAIELKLIPNEVTDKIVSISRNHRFYDLGMEYFNIFKKRR